MNKPTCLKCKNELSLCKCLERQPDGSWNEEIAILKADLAYAIGYCRGLGHPINYLEKKYPELKEGN